MLPTLKIFFTWAISVYNVGTDPSKIRVLAFFVNGSIIEQQYRLVYVYVIDLLIGNIESRLSKKKIVRLSKAEVRIVCCVLVIISVG